MFVMSQPRNFSWFVEGKLAAMGYPMNEDLAFLAEQGIKTLIDLTGSCLYRESAVSHGFTVHSIAIQDFCPPTIEQIEDFLNIVDNAENVSSLYDQHHLKKGVNI